MSDFLKIVGKFVGKGLATIWEIIFPRICIDCKKEGAYLCNSCALFVSEAGFVCPSCGKSSYFGKRHRKCSGPKVLLGMINIWDYDGIIRETIHRIKYKGVFHILEELTERIIYLFENDKTRTSSFLSFLLDEKTIITFVPVHKIKKRKRGFDQSEILAKHIAGIAGKKHFALLKRVKNTKSQAGLDQKGRSDNIQGAFAFIHQRKHIVEQALIVDDVWTSGATMMECCRILRENKIKKIWGFTLARA